MMSKKQSENESNYIGFPIKDITGAEVKKDNVRREVPPNSLASLITSFSGTNDNVCSEKSEHQNSNTDSPTTSLNSLGLTPIVTTPSNSRNIFGLISTNECLNSSTHNPNITYRERSQSIFKPIDGLQLTSALVAIQQTRRPKTSEDQLVAIEESLANFRNATSLPPTEELQIVTKDTPSSCKDKSRPNYNYNYSEPSLKVFTNSPNINSIVDKPMAHSRNSIGQPSAKGLHQNTEDISAKNPATDSTYNLISPSTKGLPAISTNIQGISSSIQPLPATSSVKSLSSPTINETGNYVQSQTKSVPIGLSLEPQSNISSKATTNRRVVKKRTDMVSTTPVPTEKSKQLQTMEAVIAMKLTEGLSSDLKSNKSSKATTTRRVMEKLADMISSTPSPIEKSQRLQNMEAVIARELTEKLSLGDDNSGEAQNISVAAEKLAKWADDLVSQKISHTRVDRHESLVEEEQESPVSARPSSMCSTFLFSESPTVYNNEYGKDVDTSGVESSDIVVTIQQLGKDAFVGKVENSDNKKPLSVLHIQQTDGSIVEVETVEDNRNKKVALVRKLKGESSNPESKDWSTWMVEVAMPTLDWTPSIKEDGPKAGNVGASEKIGSKDVQTNAETGENKLILDTVLEGSPSNQMIKEAQTFFEISNNEDEEGTKVNKDSWTNMVLEVASLMVDKMSLNNEVEPQRESLKKLPILQRQCMSSSEAVNEENCSVQKTRRMPLLERQCSKTNKQKEEDDVAHIKLGRNPVETITNIILPSPPSHNPFNDPLDNLEKYHSV